MMATNGVVAFDEAVEIVLRHAAGLGRRSTETLALLDCRGRVLAEAVVADRDQPPFDRSTRDGFAVRAAEAAGGELRVLGLVRAGKRWQDGALEQGAAIEIMTGAPMPEGADAVVMVEHVERIQGAVRLVGERTIGVGESVVRRGEEARQGVDLLVVGTVMGAAEIALAAACGRGVLRVFRRPGGEIVATGEGPGGR